MGDTTRRRVLTSMLAAPVPAGLAPVLRAAGEDERLIASAAEALDVFDFERLARAKLPPAHWGYLKTGVDGGATLRANDAGFENYSLRVRSTRTVRARARKRPARGISCRFSRPCRRPASRT